MSICPKGAKQLKPAGKPQATTVDTTHRQEWSIEVPKETDDSIDDILLLVPFTGELDWGSST
ncbi:hypothetical protein CXF72_17330 [Psychromonas sp. MB-3u-54]|nr:hypothetical protein CXF72_17330 [Psychromonas sp. MB-3u-54]